jgi:hypothetical protein
MKRFLLFVLTATSLLMGIRADACEKHLNGHQNSSDTNLTNMEGGKK